MGRGHRCWGLNNSVCSLWVAFEAFVLPTLPIQEMVRPCEQYLSVSLSSLSAAPNDTVAPLTVLYLSMSCRKALHRSEECLWLIIQP